MENATKALLIAAAVLIAILVISLTLVIYRQGADAASDADLSEAKLAEFNGRFTAFEGSNKSTTQVNALLQTVLSHNQNETQEGTNRFVTVGGSVTQAANATSISRLNGNTYYTVTCVYTGGRVTSITVTART